MTALTSSGDRYRSLELLQMAAPPSEDADGDSPAPLTGPMSAATAALALDAAIAKIDDPETNPAFMQFSRILQATRNFAGDAFVGSGHFGMVYKGTMIFGERGEVEVAVKVSKTAPAGRQAARAEMHEIHTIRSLPSHPNVASCLGYSRVGEPVKASFRTYEGEARAVDVPKHALCIIYEFVSGTTLQDWLRGDQADSCPRMPPLTWAERVLLLLDIASGLAHLHFASPSLNDSTTSLAALNNGSVGSHGIVHRDLRSANVLVRERREDDQRKLEAVIADFGLSAPVDESGEYECATRGSTPLGYTDPEYLINGRYTRKSDIFGFGVMVLELVTGLRGYHDARHSYRSLILLLNKHARQQERAREMADRKAPGDPPFELIDQLLALAGECVQLHGGDRPDASSVESSVRGIAGAMGLVVEEELRATTSNRPGRWDGPATPQSRDSTRVFVRRLSTAPVPEPAWSPLRIWSSLVSNLKYF